MELFAACTNLSIIDITVTAAAEVYCLVKREIIIQYFFCKVASIGTKRTQELVIIETKNYGIILFKNKNT